MLSCKLKVTIEYSNSNVVRLNHIIHSFQTVCFIYTRRSEDGTAPFTEQTFKHRSELGQCADKKTGCIQIKRTNTLGRARKYTLSVLWTACSCSYNCCVLVHGSRWSMDVCWVSAISEVDFAFAWSCLPLAVNA